MVDNPQQLTDIVEAEAQGAAATGKQQPIAVCGRVLPVAQGIACGPGRQPLLLVVADGYHLGIGGANQLAHSIRVASITLDLIVAIAKVQA